MDAYIYVVNGIYFKMKCVEKYDASAKGASRNFWNMLIDTRNILCNRIFS